MSHPSTNRTRKLRTLLIAVFALFATVALAACGGGSDGKAGDEGADKKLGFLVYDVGVDPWMNVAIKTVEKEGADAGFDVTVSNGHNDVGQMASAIDSFITQEVDAILVAPSDKDSLVPAVVKADAAGIPVFTFSLAMSEKAPITSFIGADDVNIGSVQGDMVLKALNGKGGKVALMTGILGSGPQLGRTEGVHKILEAEPGIEIVEEQANNWAHDKTVSLTQDWLSKYPKGELAAVVAQGPELVAGAQLAHSKGRDEIVFIGCDYPKDARKAIEDGVLYGTLNQSPAVMAEEAIKAMKTVVDGGTVDEEILIETPAVTESNVADIEAAY